jgi:hypothetical protein
MNHPEGGFLSNRIALMGFALILFAPISQCQSNANAEAAPVAVNAVPQSDDHILGIIPNFRTSPGVATYEPISPREKFRIAAQDSFDRGSVMFATAFAAQNQLSNSNRSFGQGVEGYSKYLGAAYANVVIGNYMTEAVFPTILHQDPRYFRRGTGSGWSRLGYSTGQIFWTHHDSGRAEFNYSEVLGSSSAVAISNIYYHDDRTVHNAVSSLSVQLGLDMATNILKEFWPDIDHKFRRKHSNNADTLTSH